MVEISEVTEEEPAPAAAPDNAADARSQERYDDADELEAALSNLSRPSARLHLENLITKLRKEGKALQRVAASKAAASSSGDAGATEAEGSSGGNDSPAPIPPEGGAPKDPPVPKRSPAVAPILPSNKYQSFPTYLFDAGKYNSPTVSVYVPLDGIGAHDRSKIHCNFTPGSFDLIVTDWEGKDYRLLNDNLEKNIEPEQSKCVVKPNKIILRLGKVKGEYGYESWQQLTAKKAKKRDASGKALNDDNPAAGIMDLMKDMYDEGDDNMKKMIGETMYKQRTGQLERDAMGGMGGMDDMMGGMGGMGL